MLPFRKFIAEGSNLAPAELYKYSWRVDLFLDKYKNGHPLTLTTGAEIVLKYDETKEAEVRSKTNPGKIVFLGIDSHLYKLSDFAKTVEFGGGGGSGAGAALTKLTESAQAVYAQARWMGKTEYTSEDIATAYAASRVDEELASIQHELPEDWRNSCIIGAEKLFDTFGSKGYTFHRGSAWVDRLETLFKKMNAKDKHFSNLNKWSPADIYMVSPAGANIKFDSVSNIQELNNILMDAMRNKDIIGISLKLLKKTAKLSYHNFGNDKPVVKFDKFTTGTKGFFSGKDVYIYFTLNGKIQFRTFPETFQGEIKGKQANQGKLSYGPIQTILRDLKLPLLIDVKKLRSGIEKNNTEIFNEFYEFYTRYANEGTKLSYAAFNTEIIAKGTSWIFSKFIGCQLIDIITKSNKQDDFVTSCIQYASSSTELSAPYIKLE